MSWIRCVWLRRETSQMCSGGTPGPGLGVTTPFHTHCAHTIADIYMIVWILYQCLQRMVCRVAAYFLDGCSSGWRFLLFLSNPDQVFLLVKGFSEMLPWRIRLSANHSPRNKHNRPALVSEEKNPTAKCRSIFQRRWNKPKAFEIYSYLCFFEELDHHLSPREDFIVIYLRVSFYLRMSVAGFKKQLHKASQVRRRPYYTVYVIV